MSTHNPANLDRLLDLLAAQAVEGLAQNDAAELERLLREHPEVDAAGFERAAAAVWMETSPGVEPMPASLRDRIQTAAPTIVGAAPTPRPTLRYEAEPAPAPRASFFRRTGPLAWLAAAACIGLAVLAWWPRLFPAPSPAPLTAAERRAALLARADTRTIPIAAAGITGDFAWNESLDEGYLRVGGLPANNAASEQYQLWVFDERLPGGGPMPAGVFDAPAGGEIVVPITPSLRVGNATTFAVSVEKAGGAPTPNLERVVILAK